MDGSRVVFARSGSSVHVSFAFAVMPCLRAVNMWKSRQPGNPARSLTAGEHFGVNVELDAAAGGVIGRDRYLSRYTCELSIASHVLCTDQVDWISYDGWGMHVPEGYFRFTTGPDAFVEELRRLGGEDDVKQW